MKKIDFIFMLMRSALWQKKIRHFDMSPGEYRAVMVEAEKQCVIGLIIDCLMFNNMGLQKQCVIHMMKYKNTLEMENKRLDENVIALNNILRENDINYVVVKGQIVASLYPKPYLRVPGDIDFYVPSRHFKKAAEVLNETWGLKLNGESKKMHQSFEYNANEFEIHRFLKNFPNAKRQKQFNDIIDRYPYDQIMVKGVAINTLNPTLNIFYTFVHLYGHFIRLGVALRQLCDMAVLLHHYHHQIDRGLLKELLAQFGFVRAFNAIGSILVDKLGLPEDDFPWEIQAKDIKIGLKALNLIWKHGNWGKYDRSYDAQNKNLKYFFGKTYYRISNHILFFQLSPKENLFMLFTELPKKVMKKLSKRR